MSFLLHQADIVVTGIMDDADFVNYVEMLRKEFQIPEEAARPVRTLSTSNILLGHNDWDAIVRNGKAFLRSLLYRQREFNSNENFYTKIDTADNALYYFAHLAVQELAMGKEGSRGAFESLSFVTAEIPGTDMTFATHVQGLKKHYEALPEEEQAEVLRLFSGNISADEVLQNSATVGLLQRAMLLQTSLAQENPSFAASVEALREDILALAECP